MAICVSAVESVSDVLLSVFTQVDRYAVLSPVEVQLVSSAGYLWPTEVREIE